MANPINNDVSLPYDLETPDAGKTKREHRAEEVMDNLYKCLNRIVISSTEPSSDDRYFGMIWIDSSDPSTGIWVCDKNLAFTISLGGGI